MTRLILAFLITTSTLTAAVDSVTMMPGYANQVWYRPGTLSTSSPQSSWHLGFQGGQSATIIANDALVGFKMYAVPNSTPATYATLDTTGMSTWTPIYNKPSSWTGAMNTLADPSNLYDYGWGTYNPTAHALQGSRVFVIVLGPNDIWKIFINSWAGFAYTFKYARLDGSDEHNGEVSVNGFAEKAFVYWSFTTHSAIDREPPMDSWDLTFLKYTTMLQAGPGGLVPYPVVGVLARPRIKLAKVMGADPSLLEPPSAAQFDSNAALIGHAWKTYDQELMKYTIADSTAYFILRPDGTMWRMVITAFDPVNGTTHFNTETVVTSVQDADAPNTNVLGIYPNIANAGDVVSVAFDASASISTVQIIDVRGNLVRTIGSNLDAGLHAVSVATTDLAAGQYRIVVQSATHAFTAPLIIQ